MDIFQVLARMPEHSFTADFDMKKLIGRGFCILAIIVFLMGALIVLSSYPLFSDKLNLLTDSGGYANAGTDEVTGVLDVIRNDSDSKKLILGDSVAGQVFISEKFDNALVATGNQSMTFIWQYIFVKEFIDTHPDATDVYIAIAPDSLNSVWHSYLSYQYVLMPLVKYGYLDELDDVSRDELADIYGEFFMKEQVVRMIDNSGINRKLFLNYVQATIPDEIVAKEYTKVTRIPNDYLVKIYELCREKDVSMHLICCPCKDTPENRAANEELSKNYALTDIGALFPNYFEGITYYPADEFKDAMHFKDNLLTSDFKREIIEKIEEKSGVLLGL